METEIETTNFSEKGWIGKIKDWSYENWQTIIVVLIVLIVGISAYNYNQQNNLSENQNTAIVADNNESEDNAKQENNESHEINKEITEAEAEAETENKDQIKAAEEDNKSDAKNNSSEEPSEKVAVNSEEKNLVISNSTDSGKIYTVSANRGEGITHLARRALNEFLQETEEGSDLIEEHKVYIEDYLQNKTGNEIIEVDHQETFSENLIKEAISNARQLTPKSLNNLTKYVR